MAKWFMGGGLGGLTFEDKDFARTIQKALKDWFEIPRINYLSDALSGMGIKDDYYFVQKEEADDYHVRMLISSEKGKNKYTLEFRENEFGIFFLKANDECEWKTYLFKFKVIMEQVDLDSFL